MHLSDSLRALTVAGALVMGISPSVLAQPAADPPSYRYLTIAYQKPEPGKTADYIRLEREYWKPLHQERVKNGRILSWKLYGVNFPNGEEQEIGADLRWSELIRRT